MSRRGFRGGIKNCDMRNRYDSPSGLRVTSSPPQLGGFRPYSGVFGQEQSLGRNKKTWINNITNNKKDAYTIKDEG